MPPIGSKCPSPRIEQRNDGSVEARPREEGRNSKQKVDQQPKCDERRAPAQHTATLPLDAHRRCWLKEPANRVAAEPSKPSNGATGRSTASTDRKTGAKVRYEKWVAPRSPQQMRWRQRAVHSEQSYEHSASREKSIDEEVICHPPEVSRGFRKESHVVNQEKYWNYRHEHATEVVATRAVANKLQQCEAKETRERYKIALKEVVEFNCLSAQFDKQADQIRVSQLLTERRERCDHTVAVRKQKAAEAQRLAAQVPSVWTLINVSNGKRTLDGTAPAPARPIMGPRTWESPELDLRRNGPQPPGAKGFLDHPKALGVSPSAWYDKRGSYIQQEQPRGKQDSINIFQLIGNGAKGGTQVRAPRLGSGEAQHGGKRTGSTRIGFGSKHTVQREQFVTAGEVDTRRSKGNEASHTAKAAAGDHPRTDLHVQFQTRAGSSHQTGFPSNTLEQHPGSSDARPHERLESSVEHGGNLSGSGGALFGLKGRKGSGSGESGEYHLHPAVFGEASAASTVTSGVLVPICPISADAEALKTKMAMEEQISDPVSRSLIEKINAGAVTEINKKGASVREAPVVGNKKIVAQARVNQWRETLQLTGPMLAHDVDVRGSISMPGDSRNTSLRDGHSWEELLGLEDEDLHDGHSGAGCSYSHDASGGVDNSESRIRSKVRSSRAARFNQPYFPCSIRSTVAEGQRLEVFDNKLCDQGFADSVWVERIHSLQRQRQL